MTPNPSDPRPATRLSRLMVAASARINYEWALRRPGQPPFYMLTEFPRSGGNWIRDLMADVLQLPAPRFSRFPITFRSIVHNHDHRPTDHPTIYALRDPRDVFLSHFHKTVAAARKNGPAIRQKVLARHPSLGPLLANVPDGAPIHPDLSFYDEWIVRSLGARVSWPSHVRAFLSPTRDNVVVIRYEDMMTDGHATLTRAVTDLCGRAPEPDVVAFALMRNAFARQAGRKPGETDNTATKRQGIAGAWRRDLPESLVERFARDMAEVLTLAGYPEQ